MEAHHLTHGNGEQAIGVVITQVVFRGKRKLNKIAKGLNIAGHKPQLLECVAIERNFVINAAYSRTQSFFLQGMQL
jgi:hypothetical protein